MTKTKVILVAAFLLVFAAGGTLGAFIFKLARPAPPPPSWLATELNLNDTQREQMRTIWSETMAPLGQMGERRAKLSQDRDQQITSLLSPDKQAEYEKIKQDYAQKLDGLSQERKKAFDAAVEKTKLILTPEQVAKYDEILKDREQNRQRGEEGGGFGPRHRRSTSSSRPTTDERPALP